MEGLQELHMPYCRAWYAAGPTIDCDKDDAKITVEFYANWCIIDVVSYLLV